MGDEEARSNRGLGYVDALDGPLSDGGSIPPASILEPLEIQGFPLLDHEGWLGIFSCVRL